MEAKLIKNIDGYELFTQGFLKGSTNHELIDSLNIEEGTIRYKLSLKNCEAIERGYDLDELAKSEASKISETEVRDEKLERIYKRGFQKALELMGDKKFSDNDMENAIEMCIKLMNDKGSEFREHKQTVIQSLQQTEWEVEIEMGGYRFNDDGEKIGFPSYELPKLDADGNLILKRK